MSANEHDDDQPDSFDVIERLRARVVELEAALKLSRPFVNIATSAGQAEASRRWYNKAVAALAAIDAALAKAKPQGSGE